MEPCYFVSLTRLDFASLVILAYIFTTRSYAILLVVTEALALPDTLIHVNTTLEKASASLEKTAHLSIIHILYIVI